MSNAINVRCQHTNKLATNIDLCVRYFQLQVMLNYANVAGDSEHL